ncbi:dynamin family protein [Fischerella thermalis]|jgi:GTPase Era involved in 16S rRNA processing|uniref:dynamin family protein n=1 Tax=Fischerella thermalis TaxID=372787 RepID=UPI00031E2D53|nr:dynamin family protein [Fischerella thermalis]PLZ24860.1 dynamin family protein [Fischerella thermalis WC341]PLZ34110.1 dynamin family protein [Fischerella thermalis WC559]PLZ53156.1 dynamin family protein [Fischerella thermalis WC442]PLZ81789.1 dynamin family protein [Fischerella thermalis WC213]PMB35273.1 dynamin family protein [Fischerella thermalis BR2B]
MKADTNQNTPLISLTDYNKLANNLVLDLKRLRSFSEKLNIQQSLTAIDDVLEKIENKTFWVAVVGEFKRGKSTFINALLGQEILPSDIEPCSATINRVTYSLNSYVEVEFKDGRKERVEIDKLSEYVTKLTPEAEATAANVKEAVVYYPAPYCRNNVDIIDTPGLNDDPSMTGVTLSVLPKVDAAILVIMAQSPVSEVERDFLENKLLTNDLGRVIFVVTGIDRCNRPGDADKVIASVRKRIKEYVLERAAQQWGEDSAEYEVYLKKIGEPKVFGLSAYQALEAKDNNDDELLAKSRFQEFEKALEQFLARERGAIELQVPLNRVIASAGEILSTINIQENALKMKLEDFEKTYETSIQEISELRRRKKEEMQLIDRAAENVRYNVRPLLNKLEEELKQTAIQVIDSTTITAKEVSNKKALTEKLGRKVSNSLQNTGQKLADKIQTEIQKGLAEEIDRLQDFANSVVTVLNRIEMQFVDVEADAKRKRSAGGEAVAAALAVFTGFGGIWAGFRIAGVKGAAVGAVGSFGTAFGAGMLAASIGLPITWPALVAIGVVSIFTGGWLTRLVFGGEQVEAFKENYKAAILQEIEKQMKSNPINQKVEDHISASFDHLKQTLSQEVEALLDNTQNTLTELNQKRQRNEALTEAEQKELDEMRAETERILGSAQRRSQELVEIMSV